MSQQPRIDALQLTQAQKELASRMAEFGNVGEGIFTVKERC